MIIDLATVKQLKNITGTNNDAFITALIPCVQNQIEEYLDRKLDAQDYYEELDYSNILLVSQYPVNNIKFVGSTIKLAELSSTDYNYEVTASTDSIPYSLIITDSNLVSNTFLLSTNTTMAALKASVEGIYAGLITMSIEAGCSTISTKLLKVGNGRVLLGYQRQDISVKVLEPRTIEISQDYSYVWCAYSYGERYPLLIVYNAGYITSNCPSGLKQIIANIISDIISTNPISLQGYIKSESNYNYSYTIGTEVYNSINQEVAKYYDSLWPYKRKSI